MYQRINNLSNLQYSLFRFMLAVIGAVFFVLTTYWMCRTFINAHNWSWFLLSYLIDMLAVALFYWVFPKRVGLEYV